MSVHERTRHAADPSAAPFRRADGRPWGSRFVTLIAGLRQRAVPSQWSLLFGAASAACMVVLVVTGLFLMIDYTPSSTRVRYDGAYPLLRGVEMSEAYASTLRISFEVPAGLLMRQAHHWAALLLPAVLLLQLLHAFFTGAYRRPRHWQWVLLCGIFFAALLGGWSGYALPDDLLAGTGLRIFHGVLLGIPGVGTALSMLIFGGEFPGRVLAHLYPIHVVVAPVALVLLWLIRLRLAYRGRPAQFFGPGRTAGNVVGLPLWPTMATKWIGMFMITAGVITLSAGLAEISPVWQQGPSSPAAAGAGSQPDWYTAFLDGALRLVPPGWEIFLFGRTWTLAVIVPLLAVSLFFAIIVAYPFLEGWITDDTADHHFLDRPRDVPVRTGIGVAGLVFYLGLWAVASADLVATQFQLSFNTVIHVLQVVVTVGPLVGFLVTYTACRGLQEAEHQRLVHGAESGQIVRLPSGGYVEKHRPLAPRDRFVVASLAPASPPGSRRDRRGRTRQAGLVRNRLGRLYLTNARSPQRSHVEVDHRTGQPALEGSAASVGHHTEEPAVEREPYHRQRVAGKPENR